MANTTKNIERLHGVLVNTICTTQGRLSYDRIQDGLIKLCAAINAHYDADPDQDETVWYTGQDCEACIVDLITGAFWHFTEWHDGKKGYQTLSALGTVYSPGYETGPEPETGGQFVFDELANMAEQACPVYHEST